MRLEAHHTTHNVPLVCLPLATEPALLEDILIVPAHSLSKQVHEHYLPYLAHFEPDEDVHATKREIDLRNRYFNADGFGVAW
jgi:glutamine amidotransferase